MIAEVVSKAFLEHVFYEGEAQRTKGEKHLGTTARIASIAKMATQSANASPLHTTDSYMVDQASVQDEVMNRLKSSLSQGTTHTNQSIDANAMSQSRQ